MKNKILSTCLQGNLRDGSVELKNTAYCLFWADRVRNVSDRAITAVVTGVTL